RDAVARLRPGLFDVAGAVGGGGLHDVLAARTHGHRALVAGPLAISEPVLGEDDTRGVVARRKLEHDGPEVTELGRTDRDLCLWRLGVDASRIALGSLRHREDLVRDLEEVDPEGPTIRVRVLDHERVLARLKA